MKTLNIRLIIISAILIFSCKDNSVEVKNTIPKPIIKNVEVLINNILFVEWEHSNYLFTDFIIEIKEEDTEWVYIAEVKGTNEFKKSISYKLKEGTFYKCRMKAKKDKVESEYSYEKEFNTIINLAPVLTFPINNSKNNETEIILEWAAHSFAEKYAIEVSIDEEFQVIYLSQIIEQKTHLKVKNLSVEAKYYVRIKALNKNSESHWNVFNFSTKKSISIPNYAFVPPSIWNFNYSFKWFTSGFYISKYETTQKEWVEIMQYNPSFHKGDNLPVERVSFNEVLIFCNKKSIKDGLEPCYIINGETDPNKWGALPDENSEAWNDVICNWEANGYRLPTEIEWLSSAQVGFKDHYVYSGSDILDEVGWYLNNSKNQTNIIGQKKPNELGLYDITGNVWEWCWDKFNFFPFENTYNYKGSEKTKNRSIKGGSWFDSSSFCHIGYRSSYFQAHKSFTLGFRLARTK